MELSAGPRGVDSGTVGIWLKNGADVLVKGVRVATRFVRDIAVQGLQPLTVIANCKCACLHALLSGMPGLIL